MMRHLMREGRKPSRVWRHVADDLALYGLTPAEYIGDMRAGGASWAEIGNSLADDCELDKAPQAGTLQFWLVIESHVDMREWVNR